jgi:hypothetical protein
VCRPSLIWTCVRYSAALPYPNSDHSQIFKNFGHAVFVLAQTIQVGRVLAISNDKRIFAVLVVSSTKYTASSCTKEIRQCLSRFFQEPGNVQVQVLCQHLSRPSTIFRLRPSSILLRIGYETPSSRAETALERLFNTGFRGENLFRQKGGYYPNLLSTSASLQASYICSQN